MALTQQAVPAPQPRLGPSGLLVENEFEVSLNFQPFFNMPPKKKAKTIALRTLTACDGFTIAMINIFIGAFVV